MKKMLKFRLVGCRVKFHPTYTTYTVMLLNILCSPACVTKNQGGKISLYLWMFFETSHEMHFTETTK